MIISSPHFEKGDNDSLVRINFRIKSDNFEKNLWFELENKYENFLSQSCDPALIALLIPAMHAGENIHIDGIVSEKLMFNMFSLQKLLQIIIPSLNIIKVTFKQIIAISYDSKYVATGFSGGIDSFTSLHDYYYHCKNDHHKITHLTYHNAGNHVINSFDTPFAEQKKLFDKRFSKISKAFTEQEKSEIPFIKIDSNLDNFFISKELNFQQTHTLRNVSILLLLQKGMKRFYLSSSVSYKDIAVKRHIDTAIMDPILLPLLSTESLDLISVGSEYTRVEKTLKIADLSISRKFLDVCTNSQDGTNCSKCFKCMRTQFTLDLSGKLKEFSAVFDLKIYEEHKTSYIHRLKLNLTSLSSEILAYAKSLSESESYVSADIFLLVESAKNVEKLKNERIRNLLEKADSFYKKNDIIHAVDLYKLIHSLDPTTQAGHILDLMEQNFRI